MGRTDGDAKGLNQRRTPPPGVEEAEAGWEGWSAVGPRAPGPHSLKCVQCPLPAALTHVWHRARLSSAEGVGPVGGSVARPPLTGERRGGDFRWGSRKSPKDSVGDFFGYLLLHNEPPVNFLA